MPEADKEGKNYHVDVPQKGKLFFLKGSTELDWGMKNRLARIFNPKDGRTVMLAIDHGYFQGPTSGLERIDVNIMPLVPDADVVMCTRGILRTIIPPDITKPIVSQNATSSNISTKPTLKLLLIYALVFPQKPFPVSSPLRNSS